MQQHEDPDTLTVRTQLLGLQQTWPDMGAADRTAILDLILDTLPKSRVKQQAHRIAQLYDQVGQGETPQVIVSLRVSLRRKGGQGDGVDLKGEEHDASSASTGDTEVESRAAAGGAPATRHPKKTKKRRVEAQRKADPRCQEAAMPSQTMGAQEAQDDRRPPEQGSQSIDIDTQDERQMEQWQEKQLQEEYQKQLDEDAAEAEYLASYQAELDIAEVMEACDRAQQMGRAADTCLDHNEDDSEGDLDL